MKIILVEGEPWPPIQLNLTRSISFGSKEPLSTGQLGDYKVEIILTYPDHTVRKEEGYFTVVQKKPKQ